MHAARAQTRASGERSALHRDYFYFTASWGGDLARDRFARHARPAAGPNNRTSKVIAGRRAGAHHINVIHGYFDPATIIT